jgi:5-methylcytosine-specific restriction endonuclease McrBC regulatory subunit McrC
MTSGPNKSEFIITESKIYELALSDEDSQALRSLQDKWRTPKVTWFRSNDVYDEDLGSKVLDVRSLRNGKTEVKVFDAIGAIDLPSSVIIVQPKIPIPHFNYIASQALSLPRMYSGNFGLQQGAHFLELICAWAIDSIEAILRDGLVRDYKETRAPIQTVKGRVHMASTFLNIARGNLAIDSTFEEYSVDTALNRVLKNALEFIAKNPAISDLLKKRAKRNLLQFSTVGPLRKADLKAVPQRNSNHYRDALHFANQVVLQRGVELGLGVSRARSFLYKTPLLIEEGIRTIIRTGIAPVHVVKPKRVNLTSSTGKNVSANPDLGISEMPLLVGDVKYKIQTKDWRRSDLAQSVFFAVAYEAPKSLIIDFENEESKPNGDLQVSNILVSALGWDASSEADPEESAKKLIDEVKSWLGKSSIKFVSELTSNQAR